MARGTSRNGFTLVELMVALAISALVLTAVTSALIGGIRLLNATYATAEMSMRTRDLRDRLLFQAAPPHNDTIWAGLLSGTNKADVLEGNATKILMYCAAMKDDGSATANQTIQLIFKDYGTPECSSFSEDRYDEHWLRRWLRPGNLNFLTDSASRPPLVWARKVDGSEDHSRFYIHLRGRTEVAGLPIEHGERIVVPVFGRQQTTYADGKGGLDR